MVVGHDESGGPGENGTPENFTWCGESGGCSSQGNEVATQGSVFAIQINAVKCFLHWIFLECTPEVVGRLGRSVEDDFFAKGDQ
jgi:hypothetical protein